MNTNTPQETTSQNMVESGNWITIYRDIKDHWIYKNNLYFSAWVKLLLSVNHSPCKVMIKGTLVQCDRGQSIRSVATYADDFGKGWTTQKVRTFFRLLEDDKMIATESVKISTRLSICNYDTYQPSQQASNKHLTRSQQGANKVLTTNKKNKKNKNENNEKKKDSCAEVVPTTPPADFVMDFKCNGEPKEWYLTQSKLDEWKASYLNIDVQAECRNARQWLIDNPSRRKTANGMTRFLGSWISRSVNSGKATSLNAQPKPRIL